MTADGMGGGGRNSESVTSGICRMGPFAILIEREPWQPVAVVKPETLPLESCRDTNRCRGLVGRLSPREAGCLGPHPGRAARRVGRLRRVPGGPAAAWRASLLGGVCVLRIPPPKLQVHVHIKLCPVG